LIARAHALTIQRMPWMLFVVMFAGGASLGESATFPAGFSQSEIATGLTETIGMAFSPDGRLFVCEKPGRVRVVKNGILLTEPFLTLDVETEGSDGSNGLLGVAFDPAFGTNGFFYVHYTARASGESPAHNRISRFTAQGDRANPATETVILELHEIDATGHYGGDMHFGPDGKLYVAIGEYDSPDSAQLLTDFKGKILRINADGTIPSDNPFINDAAGPYRAIWALGFRNPFTFAFAPGSGRMFVNDIGEQTFEEIDEVIAGGNYGWPDAEGPGTNPDFLNPIYYYGRDQGCALTAGTFYSPIRRRFPARFAGKYFFADWCDGWIKVLDPANPASIAPFGTGTSRLMDLEIGVDGNLYYIEWPGSSVFKVEYTGVDITGNGNDGPSIVHHGEPLQIALTFQVKDPGVLSPAELYFGVVSPFGVFWFSPTGVRPTPTRLYAGPLPAFGPATFLDIPDVAVLPAGTYYWFAVVDPDANGIMNGPFADVVQTTISP
jgi:glucose/arabinose dehydrogenase